MLPVVAVVGDVSQAVDDERVFLGNFCFKLNTPHVFHLLQKGTLDAIRPDLSRKLLNAGPQCKLLRPKPDPSMARVTMSQSSRPFARLMQTKQHGRKGVGEAPLLRNKPCAHTTTGKILLALQFNRRDKVAKQGLKLLYLLRCCASLSHIFHLVRKHVPSSARSNALTHVRRRARQIGLQLPLPRFVVQIPWCFKVENVQVTKMLLQEFANSLFLAGTFQPSVYTNGSLKCQITWKPARTVLSHIRTAPMFNKHLHDPRKCPCRCQINDQGRLRRIRGADGKLHVCSRQSEIVWPMHCDLLCSLPVQTRVLPTKTVVVDELKRTLCRVAHVLKDPLKPPLSDGSLEVLSRVCANKFADAWDIPKQSHAEPLCGNVLTVTAVSLIRHICHGFFVEALDKNSSEFVVMCPRLYYILASGVFQFTGCQELLEGVQCRTTQVIHAQHLGSQITVPAGTVVNLQLIQGDCNFFREFACTASTLQGCLARVEGEHFNDNQLTSSWLDVGAVSIPDLRCELQPHALNKRFAALWRSMLSLREPSWGRVRAVPKNKCLLAGRPLGDQSCNPTAILCRTLSRFLDLCLRSIPSHMHFDRSTHDAMIATFREVNGDPFGSGVPLMHLQNYGLVIVSKDVDKGFMRVWHDEALNAWNFLAGFLRELGLLKAWINPSDTSTILGPSRFATWSKQPGKSWVVFSLEDVSPILRFLFRHMQFCFGGAQGSQKSGVMMGIGAG